MINGIHHPAIVAVDLEGLADWYHAHLGFEKVWKYESPTEHIAFLRSGYGYLELFQYFAPPATLSPRRPTSQSGLVHFCVDVSDIEAEHARLSAAGVEFTDPPMAVGPLRYTFCFDPEGNCIELIELLDTRIPFHLARSGLPVAAQRSGDDWAEVQEIGHGMIETLLQR